jgi:hypothetical protein
MRAERAEDYAESTQRKSVCNLATIWPMNRRFFETIGLLVVRPWKLANQFLAGRLPSIEPVPQPAQD